jgi:hypothetical protein
MAAPQNVFPTLAMIAITLTNGLVHIASAIVQLAYNPGLLTSLLLFLPMSWIAFRVIPARRSQKVLALAWAALAHILMALGMMASTWWGVISPQIFYISLIAWSLLPLLFTDPRRTII